MKQSFLVIAFAICSLLILPQLSAQNSLVGDGFGGRKWYVPTNYEVSSYCAFNICGVGHQLYGWGSNFWWALANNSYIDPIGPVACLGMTSVQFFSGGYMQGAIKTDGTAWAWATGSVCGSTGVFAGTPIFMLNDAKFVDGGVDHIVFVKNDGTVWGAGYNCGGQLGIGGLSPSTVCYRTPVQVSGITNAVRAVAVGIGPAATLILLADGTVKITGGSKSLRYDTASVPVTMPELTNIVDIKGNSYTAFALDSAGQVFGFGVGWTGLGNQTPYPNPPAKITFPAGAAPIVALSANADGDATLALDEEGKVYGWGPGGVIGAGPDSLIRMVPTLVATNVVDIGAGESFSYIVKADGTLWASGKSQTAPGATAGSIWMNLSNTARDTFTKINPPAWFGLCSPVLPTSCLNPLAQPAVSVVQPTCTIATGSITVTSPAGSSLSYSTDSGRTYSNTTGIFNGLVAGVYKVRVKDTGQCISPVTTVTINPQPITPPAPAISITQPTCTAATGIITITSPTGFSYSITGANYGTSPTFTGVSPGTYIVTAQGSGGCISPATVAIINIAPGAPAAPAVTVTQPNCTTPTGTITITPPIGTGLTYSIDGVDYSNTTGLFANVASGSYNVRVKNSSGCVSVATAATINAAPGIPADPVATVIHPTCLLPFGIITVTSPTGAGLVYSIDGVSYTNTTGVFNNVAPGSHNLTVSNGSCTSSSTVATVNAVPKLTITLAATPNPVSAGNVVSLVVSGSSPFTVTSWMPLADFVNQTATSQTIVANASTIYSVTAKTADDCLDTAQIKVSVSASDEIYIPNTFTPDNNGHNDVFFVYGNSIDKIEIIIWNQWGEKIFSTKDKTEGWNGMSKGKAQPTGVYIYSVKILLNNDKEMMKKGFVNLVR